MRGSRSLAGPLTRVFFATLALIAAPATVSAGPFDDRPKLLLHVRTTTDPRCTSAPVNDCAAAVTTGPVSTPNPGANWVYVLATPGRVDNLAGVQFGIDYQEGAVPGTAPDDGVGLDIYSWTLCATLQFDTPGATAWPRPGGGTIITWDSTGRCQSGDVAVVGYFYIGVYGPDLLRLTERPIDGAAKVADCDAIEYRLQPRDLGRASFGGAGGGCNPCVASCVEGGGVAQDPPAALIHLAAPAAGADPCDARALGDCEEAVVTADRRLASSGFAFLVAEPGGNFARVKELRAGITYQGGAAAARRDRQGLEILGWTLCAAAEVPTTGERPWPAPGSGNVISWSPADVCAREAPAVAGYFYVTSYAADTLRIVPHPGDEFLMMTRCNDTSAALPADRAGFAVWSDGDAVGCNPCLGPCPTGVAVQPATWSRIKTLPRGR